MAVGIVPAQMALSFFILTLWAFGEAVLDVKCCWRAERYRSGRQKEPGRPVFPGCWISRFEGDRGMLRGWKNIYGVFKLLDLSHGSENKKFPDDGSDPVEYPDGTGGFLSGELRIPD